MDLSNMPTRYDASSTESKWYGAWERAGLFQPDADPAKPKYSVTIPPPNITGSLHMGHALCYGLQDFFGRYQRMQGKSVLILPGQDHAGIATQSVVDKQLRKEGLSAGQLGREKFIERVWEWREESGGTILRQFRALGCAFDWERTRFTLDPEYAEAVLHVFIKWFELGLIFRGKRVVNWDPKLKTSVSDIETVRETRKGKLYHIRYPFADGSGEIVIATTRPETMLADVAVAVHPSDKRYEGKIGKNLVLPLVGREIPLISDIYPDPNFGTGAVKITPSHDPNDYGVGTRHNLPMPVVLDLDARVKVDEILPFAKDAAKIEKYQGLDRIEARKQIVADLEAEGFLVEVEDHEIPIIISDRSGEVIEPLLSEQWFVDQPALAKPVIESVNNKEITFHPARFERIFQEWLENIREWCISRQLWWGHRIPIYYTEDGTAFAGLSWDEAQAKAGDKKIVSQDDDVLDTWFSSGLWPFATMGWPKQTDTLERYYPTSLLVTDRNIINLWVARMAMMGIDLAGAKPFEDVMIYATVLREDGRRMSKSLGTGIDPMDVINTIGADALRWTLLSQTGENQDLRYSERKTEEARNFANKIWNATRFVLMNVEKVPSKPAHLEPVDQWLLSRLVATEKAVRGCYEGYDLQSACQALYKFFWNDVCDWYIEVTKSRLQDPAQSETPQWVLLQVFDAFLKMLHPVMPHLTEELYSFLPGHPEGFLMAQPWPTFPAEYEGTSVDQINDVRAVDIAIESTKAIRNLRASVGIPAMEQIPRAMISSAPYWAHSAISMVVPASGWVGSVEISAKAPEEKVISAMVGGVEVHLPVQLLKQLDKMRPVLLRDVEKAGSEIAKLTSQLQNEQFIERAKPEVVQKLRDNLADAHARLAKLEERLALIS